MKNNKIEKINKDSEIIAIIIPANYRGKGIEFFTPDTFSQQMGYMCHPKGYKIAPHIHNDVPRIINYTQEVLIIKEGLVEVSLFTNKKEFICKRLLRSGDIILLANGGHSFEMFEETSMIEIKQGPYIGKKDKTRFKIGQK